MVQVQYRAKIPALKEKQHQHAGAISTVMAAKILRGGEIQNRNCRILKFSPSTAKNSFC